MLAQNRVDGAAGPGVFERGDERAAAGIWDGNLGAAGRPAGRRGPDPAADHPADIPGLAAGRYVARSARAVPITARGRGPRLNAASPGEPVTSPDKCRVRHLRSEAVK